MAHTKVLVITPQYAPDFGPSVPIYTALCEDLASMDYDVTVVTAFPHYAGSDAAYHGPQGLIAEERLRGVRVVRTWVYTVPKAALWRRLLYHASFNLFSTLGALRVGKPAILLADAPTLWSGLPLLVFSIAGKVPFIYVVHDIYPDVMVRLGVLRNQHIVNWIAGIERFFYDRSAQISVLSEGFKDNLVRKSVAADKVTVIPACVDVDFLEPPGNANELRERWGLTGKFVVLYAGNIGLSQGLEIVLEAAEMLLDCPDIAFVVVGEGANRANLQAQAEARHLSNIRFFPFQPREDVPLVYALADVCLVSLKRDIVVESVPSKTYTIMASSRPIVATVDPNTEVGRLLDQTRCGFCVEPEDPRALVQAVMRLYEDRPLGREMGRCGRDFVIEHYSRQVASRGYDALIRTFANGGGR